MFGKLSGNMRKLRSFILSCGMLAFAAQAETVVWTGTADSDWSKPANWEPQKVPAAADVAKFTQTATVTPPADFGGVLWVSEAAVTLKADVDAEFSLRLGATNGTKSAVTKTGKGTLKLHPYRGMNFGTVTVSAGEVDFAGNGEEAPGAFDKLVVAADAKVRIIDSPITTRHGAVQHGGYVSSEAKPEGYDKSYYLYFESDDSTFADTVWDTWFCCTTRVSRVYVPQGPDHPLLYQNLGTPDVLLATKAPTAIFHRAIVLSETSTSGLLTIQSGDNGSGVMTSVFRDGVNLWHAQWKNTYSKTVSTPLGWHELKTIHWSEASFYGWKVSWQAITRDPLVRGDSGRITEDVLWLGVCFNAIDVKAGGEIAIADGQALAVAHAENLNLAGDVTSETANAYFSVMASYRSQAALVAGAKVLNGLDRFTGTLEIGRSAWVRLPANAKDASYTIEGKGEVLAATGTEDRFSSAFTGTINVPAGETFVLADGQVNAVTGEGTVKLAQTTTAQQLAGFRGERMLYGEGGNYTLLDEFGYGTEGTLELKDGQAYTIERVDLLNHGFAHEAMPEVDDTTAWTYKGASPITRIVAPDGTIVTVDQAKLPYIEDGKLVLSDACDKSRRGVFLTGLPLTKDDEWSCEFDVSAYLPKPSPYVGQHGWTVDYRAGYFCFFLCDGGPGETYDSNRAWQAWKGTCGFTHAYWDKGTIGTAFGGYVEGGGLTGEQIGIDLTRPYHMKVVGHFGQVTATLSQDGHTYVRSIDASESFASGTATIGLCASSDYWNEGNAGMPWTRIEVSNFKGSRRVKAAAAFSTGDAADADRAISSANWTVADESSISDSTLTLCPSTAGGYAYGQAVCNTPISPRQAFEVEYDITYSKSAGSSTATLQAILLQTEGTKPVRTKSGIGAGAYYLKNTTSYGLVTQSYENYCNWVSGKGDVHDTEDRHDNQTIKITANKANHVRLTYDGAGTLHIVYASDGKTDDSSYTFRNLANETKDLYLMFSLGTTWAACGEVKITNFTFTPRTVTHQVDPLTTRLAVEAGGAATVKLPDVASDGFVPTLSNVALVGGTSLTIEPSSSQTAAKIAVTVAGEEGAAATLTAAGGTDLVFDSFTFTGATPSLLNLTGAGTVAFVDPLPFTVPAAWKSLSSVKLVNYSGLTRNGNIPVSRPLTDETGTAFRSVGISAGAASFTFQKDGLLLIFR